MRKVITFGVFDYFHLGHLRLFENCKKYGDYLIVAVQNDDYIHTFKPDAQVLYSTEERLEIVKALKVVDEVIIYDAIGPEILEKIDFDTLILGEDQNHEGFHKAEKWCDENKRQVIRMKRTQGISSSHIKNQIN